MSNNRPSALPQLEHENSSPDSDGNTSNNAAPNAKRRPSRAGTRSVATLSAAQLERKRANDREAQRAIRLRTKEHIEKLEQRIRDLESPGQPTNEQLGAALRRNKELEDEVAYMRIELHKLQSSLGVHDQGGPVWENGNQPSRSHSMQMMNPPQIPPPTAIPNCDIPRSDPYAGYRAPSQWQAPTTYSGVPPRPKREMTPSTTSDNSPETRTAWAADRNPRPDNHTSSHQPEYPQHILVPPSQQPMSLRPGSHGPPYQTPPHESQGYLLASHGAGQQAPPNSNNNQYAPVHGNQSAYMPHHAQQHAQQAQQQAQQQPVRSPGPGSRHDQNLFYGGFPQG